MDILGFPELGVDVVFLRNGAGQADRYLRGFLHYIAKAAGEFGLAGAVEYQYFKRHKHAAYGGPRHAVHKTYFVVSFEVLRQVLLYAEEICDVLIGDRDLLLAGNQLLSGLAADIRDGALQLSHAGFAGVEVDDGVQRLIVDLEGRRFLAVLLELLREQVLFRNVEFFLAGVA